jgi:hypothetical protein
VKYSVLISASITPQYLDSEGRPNYSGNSLHFSRTFDLEGERFSDIATRVDALVDAVENAVRDGAL